MINYCLYDLEVEYDERAKQKLGYKLLMLCIYVLIGWV